MNTREKLQAQFLHQHDWGSADIKPLAGDASNRRYDRLTKPNGQIAVLMDAPPDKGEDVRPFINIAMHLDQIGLSAPKIFATGIENGFLLIEDLGDKLFAREVIAKPDIEDTLYQAAVDVLCHLHRAPSPDLAVYDAKTTTPLAALSFDWYQYGATDTVDLPSKSAFSAVFASLLEPLDQQATVLIQRDYHAENLLWLPDRSGVKRVGLLDFQDAMLGHPTYDLVSILQDARRDVSASTAARMKARYLDLNPQDKDAFEAAYAIMGTQRNLRILGVFARLCLRDGKAHYVDLIPRVWDHVQTNLAHPALRDVRSVVNAALPRPSAKLLSALKSKCASCPGR